ncbi:MAG: hypothetical protein IPL42_09440 [Saprospiraceae bacterium]|nr:hypothetical protein [Saprospiraceae bacterium]
MRWVKSGVSLYDIIIPTIIYDYATGKLKGEDKTKPKASNSTEPQLETSYKPKGSNKNIKENLSQSISNPIQKNYSQIIY